MLKRKDMTYLENWLRNSHKGLLVTGARQIGKTYLIREACRASDFNLVEFNLIEQPDLAAALSTATTAKDILVRLSAATTEPLEPGKTIIFIDEVQVLKELITKIKFLVEEGSYKYIYSGSLLGVELSDIRSVPVGFLEILEMFPLDFWEFLLALQVKEETLALLEVSFINKAPVDDFIHNKIMEAFYLYLIVGGMPEAVQTYLDTNDIQRVALIHQHILALYQQDFSQYEKKQKLTLQEIYKLIPSELNKQNKRFVFKSLEKEIKFSRYEHNFLWLKAAGVALPVYNCAEPKAPLLQSKSSNLFKLFMSDVGLLNAFYSDNIKLKILQQAADINNGALFENVAAQELVAHKLEPYYYKSSKLGEIDFVVEMDGKVVLMEIKSGKNYTIHSALDNILEKNLEAEGYVLANCNVARKGKITYLPIYMLHFFRKQVLPELKVKIDLSGL